MNAERATMIGRWITQPTNITLAADQWKKFDAISHKYSAETRQIRDQAKGNGDMAMVAAMMHLSSKYQPMVRAILTPAQQAVFDKNFQTPMM